MPSAWLSVPHYQQELEHSCLAACVRMVLAHFGDVRPEAELRSLLGTTPAGTRAGNVMRVSSPAFEVYIRPSNVTELQQALADQHPVIVYLQTGVLKYWNADAAHTAVVIGIDADSVTLNDPFFTTAPQTTSLETFEEAWAGQNRGVAFIRPRKKP